MSNFEYVIGVVKVNIHVDAGRPRYSPLLPPMPITVRQPVFELDVDDLTIVRWRQAASWFEQVQNEILEALASRGIKKGA